MEFTKIKETDFDCCDSSTMFILDNGIDQFTVQLEVMLKCLRFAQEQGTIPALPDEWWCKIANHCDSTLLKKE